jgi:hypothetical protein
MLKDVLLSTPSVGPGNSSTFPIAALERLHFRERPSFRLHQKTSPLNTLGFAS